MGHVNLRNIYKITWTSLWTSIMANKIIKLNQGYGKQSYCK